MKKIILAVFAVFILGNANAQKKFEIKLNLIGALYGRPYVAGEYIVNDNFGVELNLGIAFGTDPFAQKNNGQKVNQSGFSAKVTGRFYFNPDEGCDGWYGGVYFRNENYELSDGSPSTYISNGGLVFSSSKDNNYKQTVTAGGIELGKKWLFDSGVLIDFGFGLGRTFSSSKVYSYATSDNEESALDYTSSFAIGYRF